MTTSPHTSTPHAYPIQNVTDLDYCIGCGGCAVNGSNTQITENPYGLYQAQIAAKDLTPETHQSQVCPFATSHTEDTIAQDLFSKKTEHHHPTTGYYQRIVTGHTNNTKQRLSSSSGGLTSWLLTELLASGTIDGVIHVGPCESDHTLFRYQISETPEAIAANASSRYYPTHFDNVLQSIKHTDKTYAFVGVPCFVKAIRLLVKQDPLLNKRIKYCISLFCGHLKSKAFAEMIAWQQGIPPQNLKQINFRVKNRQQSHRYSVQAQQHLTRHHPQPPPPVQARELFGMDWGLGFFKPKACDWCDDIAGETADATFGDAWLPQFQNDPHGHNIAIIRHPDLAKHLKQGEHHQSITLQDIPVSYVYQSQAGNYRHRQEGLAERMAQAQQAGIWHPEKRVQPKNIRLNKQRQKIDRLRTLLRQASHKHFAQAKAKNRFSYFLIKTLPLQLRYYQLNRRLLKFLALYAYQILRYIQRTKL
jgi:coenzyme F420-reducing hydrogenase beta subunit